MFENGQTLRCYPIKLIYSATQTNEKRTVKAMFVVPKKKFKHANERNKLKRRMREAYRLQKAEFYIATATVNLNLAFLYYGNNTEEYEIIFKATSKLLNNLMKQISTANV